MRSESNVTEPGVLPLPSRANSWTSPCDERQVGPHDMTVGGCNDAFRMRRFLLSLWAHAATRKHYDVLAYLIRWR